jgi:hypothetical protein
MKYSFGILFNVLVLLIAPPFSWVSSAIAGGVTWEKMEQNIRVKAQEEEVHFSFKFKNSGVQSIVLSEAKPSCSCTIAEIANKKYAPGESGVIAGTYKIKNKAGLSSVNIVINGNEVVGDGMKPFSDTLRLSVIVEEIVRITPGITIWKKNSEAVEREIDVVILQEEPLALKFIGLNNDHFDVKMIDVITGRKYILALKPKSTNESVDSIARIEATLPSGKKMFFSAYFLIR